MPIPDTITINFDEIDGAHRATLVKSPNPEDPIQGKSEEGRGEALIELAQSINDNLD